jgi:hypothetical protein
MKYESFALVAAVFASLPQPTSTAHQFLERLRSQNPDVYRRDLAAAGGPLRRRYLHAAIVRMLHKHARRIGWVTSRAMTGADGRCSVWERS